jgi:aminoglycoside phosphotransferase (APT) family kinase protein
MRIATVHGSLAHCEPVFTHGELGADQLLVDRSRLSVTDWDEAANGDPHFDHAWLAADLRGRGLASAWVESLARQVLGERFDAARFAWQRAAAEARRAVEGLHRCRADWRALALDRLEAADHALTLVPAMTRTSRRRGASTWLAALLDPQLRGDVPGLIAGISRVAAVWPGEDGGAIVGLARERDPSQVVRWLRMGEHVEAYDFPWDPGLPALAPLLATGRFRVAGHRFGKRAALRESGGARFLFLRPPSVLDRAYTRVRDAHRRLSDAGVCCSRPLGLATEAPAWWAEAIHGRPLEPWRERDATWRQFGATLARAHSAHGGVSVPAGGLAASLAGGRRQVALVRLAKPEFADELNLALDQVPANLAPGHAAFIHGDLHPLQVVIGDGLVILDWERARVGEAEEDLGNLFAHLAWEAGSAESMAREGILEGYAEAGGCHDPLLVFAHARASLARVRAVQSWRDGCAERARDGALWHAWLEELAP